MLYLKKPTMIASIFLLIFISVKSELVANNLDNAIRVNKCCEEGELYISNSCTPTNKVNETEWKPVFSSEDGKNNLQIQYRLVTGLPDCGPKDPWPIYHSQNSSDKLRLLPNGVLRHYFDHHLQHEPQFDELTKNSPYYDYKPGKYCMEKRMDGKSVSEFARVCAPDHGTAWTTTAFLMRNIINPLTHGVAIGCLLTVAIIYFVMPTLRDLVGNIVTSLCLCLIVSQAADLIRLLTVFDSHISRIICDTICYVSLLGAFFWLNSLGYYIWKTFRSRNVFLRITDGKKYCYYSIYTWLCTFVLGVLAVFAHFTMDYPQATPQPGHKEEIGSLGIIIFFVPVAFTILMDIFFFVTTLQIINRMHTYGRIHHKLRHSFRMFLLLLIIMTITWLFFLGSFFKFDGLINCYIIVNAFLGPLILYTCVFNQKHVGYLVRKTCCGRTPPQTEMWGDEMTAMNTSIY